LQNESETNVQVHHYRTLTERNEAAPLPPAIAYCQGKLVDLFRLKFASGMTMNAATVEFNVVGMSHEFWIAVDDDNIVGLTVLARATATQRTILYFHVSDSHKNLGIGSDLVQIVLDAYPESEFSVMPFEGTEEFYRRLGFTRSGRWEMRKGPGPLGNNS
jgi:GNAT superfamily N-acetyltransferase